MERLDALKELLAKVEDGTLRDEPYGGMPMLTQFHDGMKPHSISGFSDGFAMGAYDGSLDSAKALHEAVLPGWGVTMYGGFGIDYFGVMVSRATGPTPREFYSADDNARNPARAWLIAILKALIAQEGK